MPIRLAKICLLLAGLVAQGAQASDDFPSRNVRIVVPSSVGGGADLIARQLSAALPALWKQSVYVENKVGGGGNIGTVDVVRSAPDGYTLLVQNSTMVTNHAISPKPLYNPAKDLTPIMLVGVSPLAVFAHPSLPVGNFKELTTLVASKPGVYVYGSCGVGTPHHFAMELAKIRLGMNMQHVGYKGCAPEVADVLGGQVPIGIATANLLTAHVASGKLKVLGVSGSRPYRHLPNVPSLGSQGLGDQDFSIWYALMGPANMPASLVKRIAADVEKVLDNPSVQSSLSSAGVEPMRGGSEELAKRVSTEIEQFTRLAKQANIQSE